MKYYVIYDKEIGSYSDISVEGEFDTIEEANREAEGNFAHLSDHDKKFAHIFVGIDTDGDGFYDDMPDGAFDSDLIPEEEEDDEEC